MDASLALRLIVDPCLSWLAEMGIRRTVAAERMILAIGGQESGWTARRQMGGGPATGWWQFEKGGGVQGVLTHRTSRDKARAVCAALGVAPGPNEVHSALEQNDLLACAFARLLLYTDVAPLPETEKAAWDYYLRTWRPGKPHLERWSGNWAKANLALQS